MFLASDVRITATFMRDMFAAHAPGRCTPHPLHSMPGASWLEPPTPPQEGQQGQQQAQRSSKAGNKGSGAASVPEPELGLPIKALDAIPVAPLSPPDWQAAGWLAQNPLGAPSEREVYTERVLRAPVYRFLLRVPLQ